MANNTYKSHCFSIKFGIFVQHKNVFYRYHGIPYTFVPHLQCSLQNQCINYILVHSNVVKLFTFIRLVFSCVLTLIINTSSSVKGLSASPNFFN